MPGRKVLWSPDESTVESARITKYASWLSDRGHRFEGYRELWDWSVTDLLGFWSSVWDYFGVRSDSPYTTVIAERKMPGADWFPGTRLNYAEHILSGTKEWTAVIAASEDGDVREASWEELRRMTGSLAEALREMGVSTGDVVGAYLPNTLEAVVGLLAAASVGAVWTVCSPDFGSAAVLDRFRQARPKVLIASESYTYGGATHDRTKELGQIRLNLPTVQKVVLVGDSPSGGPGTVGWTEVTERKAKEEFARVPFAHPLWYLYSSGTTGLPKPIAHGHGGILLEHLKELALHNDVHRGDRFLWFSTTGWMMWNYMLGALLHGASIVAYDGSPAVPTLDALWDLSEKRGVTFLGVSAPFIAACIKGGMDPGSTHSLRSLRGVGSTGSPLSPEAFDWVYSHVKEELWLASISGGTDVCTAFVGGNPTLPVRSGEIQCRCLGAKVEAYDEDGKSVVGEMGELVVTEPMPSMPLYLLGDEDGSRMMESYFGVFHGKWRHGDWITIGEDGGCVIHGRSDATIKRSGVRIGTSEIYRALETVEDLSDSLAVDVVGRDGRDRLLLFVTLVGGKELDEELTASIRTAVRERLSPRHVPDVVVQAPSIPKTLNGKKLEVPVKRLLMGADPGKSVNIGSLADPESIRFYIEYAKARAEKD